jgi:hypothetical protein
MRYGEKKKKREREFEMEEYGEKKQESEFELEGFGDPKEGTGTGIRDGGVWREEEETGIGIRARRDSVIRKKDHHTPSLWHFHCKVGDAVTQLCPVVTKHSHRVRPVRALLFQHCQSTSDGQRF